MPKTAPRYTIQRSLKMRPDTYQDLLSAAEDRGMKYGRLLRVIVEEWLEGYMGRKG